MGLAQWILGKIWVCLSKTHFITKTDLSWRSDDVRVRGRGDWQSTGIEACVLWCFQELSEAATCRKTASTAVQDGAGPGRTTWLLYKLSVYATDGSPWRRWCVTLSYDEWLDTNFALTWTAETFTDWLKLNWCFYSAALFKYSLSNSPNRFHFGLVFIQR